MLNYFSGPIVVELPWQIVFIVGLIATLFLLIGLKALWLIIKYVSRVSKTNNLAKPNSQYSLAQNTTNNYLAGAVVDMVILMLVGGLIYLSGFFGRWNNDKWHVLLMILAALYVIMRLVTRLTLKVSLGEKLINRQPYQGNEIVKVTLIDLALASILFFYVLSLGFSPDGSQDFNYEQYL